MRKVASILTVLILIIAVHTALAQNVEYVASYDTPGSAFGVFVSGQFAYIADGDSGLLILDISNPSNPEPLGNLQTLYPAFDVQVLGNNAFVRWGAYFWGFSIGDIEIIDVSDPAVPHSVGGTGIGFPTDFYVSGNYVYCTWVGGFESCLYVIDVSDPESTFVVDSFGPSNNCEGIPPFDIGAVFVSGNYLYIGPCYYFEIWDVSDPYDADVIESCLGGCSRDIFVAGNYAYEACDAGGLGIVDVSNPSDPYLVGSFDTRSPARDIFVSEHYAYVAERDSGIQIIDISEPENPVLAGSYDTPGYARRIFVQDEYIYVADTSSLMVLRFTPPTDIKEASNLPGQFILNQNCPNPFNISTSISYSLPEAADITIDIYDLLGRRVERLMEVKQTAGEHQVFWDAEELPSGIYIAKLSAGSRSETIRMTLLK